mgnify:CR=1 FL=1
MFNLFKKEEPISQDIIDYYNKYKEAINYDCSVGFCCESNIDYLIGKHSTKATRENIVNNIKVAIQKIDNLKNRYPYLSQYIREEYCPMSSMSYSETFALDEDGELIETREMAIRLASMGCSKVVANTYRSDLEMLLIVILNKGFYGADWCFENLASSLDFIPKKYWDGEYCSYDPTEMITEDELINKIYEIVLFEKPIREVYDQIKEYLWNSENEPRESFSKHRQQVEEILSKEPKAKVFMRYFNHDRHDMKKLNTLIKL